MHLVVELFFDPDTEAVVRATRQALTDAGVPGVPGVGARPHVSVAVYQELDVARFAAGLALFAGERPALEVTLASLGVFLTDGCIVFLAPVVTQELLGFHRDFHQWFAGCGEAQPNYRLGSWVPHCTLAAGVPFDLMSKVTDVCRHVVRPLRGRMVSLGLVEYLPRRELCTAELGRGQG